jgi:calcineurin-like phosphoesterase family protein
MNTNLESGNAPQERKNMRFFTSDTHFGHANIIRYSNRPFVDVPAMNEALIENWNAVVRPEDTVYHLGDVALGPWTEWDSILTRLNGYKILLIGNHDRIFKGMSTKQQEKFTEHYERWFDECWDEKSINLRDGTRVNLSHFPYEGDSHGEDRYREFRTRDNGQILIHGHTHAEHDKLGIDSRVSWSNKGTLQIHVGQDAWGYRPVGEDEVIRLIDAFPS